jgi:hypothetical protein
VPPEEFFAFVVSSWIAAQRSSERAGRMGVSWREREGHGRGWGCTDESFFCAVGGVHCGVVRVDVM